MAIAVWQIDRHKLCRSPSHTLSIDETQCFACKKHPVVVLIVVIVIGLVVDLVNTLFLCITGQPDWTLVDLCPKFSLKPFGIYHQSAILFVDIIFSFLFSFFQRRPAYRRTLPPYWKRWGSRSAHRDLPQKLHFSFGQAVRARVCVCVCVCVCVSQWKKRSARRMASTASDTSNTSSKQQQAQRKKKIIYNSKRPVSSVEHCHPYRTEKRRILLNPHMSQSTCFGTLIKTGVDCKEDTGSQGQCRQQRRREKVKWRWLSNTSVWPPRLQTLRNNSHDRCVPTRACTQEEYKQN